MGASHAVLSKKFGDTGLTEHGRWVRLYNGTGSTVSAGGVVTWLLTTAATAADQLVVVADNTNTQIVGVVDSHMKSSWDHYAPEGDIPASHWGWVKISGPVTAATTSEAQTAGHAVKVHNGAIATLGGASDLSVNTEIGVVMVTATAATHTICLHGPEKVGPKLATT